MSTTVLAAESIAELFHALSDPTRLEIIGLLAGGERCVCELQDSLEAAQSRLSFHLRVLKDAGLVTDRREGRWSYYTLNADALDEVGTIVEQLKVGGYARARRSGGLRCCV